MLILLMTVNYQTCSKTDSGGIVTLMHVAGPVLCLQPICTETALSSNFPAFLYLFFIHPEGFWGQLLRTSQVLLWTCNRPISTTVQLLFSPGQKGCICQEEAMICCVIDHAPLQAWWAWKETGRQVFRSNAANHLLAVVNKTQLYYRLKASSQNFLENPYLLCMHSYLCPGNLQTERVQGWKKKKKE